MLCLLKGQVSQTLPRFSFLAAQTSYLQSSQESVHEVDCHSIGFRKHFEHFGEVENSPDSVVTLQEGHFSLKWSLSY